MNAVLLYGYGGVDQLHYETVADPIAAPGEVLVKVVATSINPIDFKLRRGALQGLMPLDLPAVLGRDVAGEVEVLGAGVTSFHVGDKVMGLVNHSYAEYLTAKAEVVTAVPEGLDMVAAGTVPLVTLTGAQLIEKGVQPKSGDVVLVTGALGSVGRAAVFVAKQHGAVVIAGVRAKQRAQAQLLGADAVVALDDDAEISELPELDAIADMVGGDTVGKLLPKLKKSGRLASVVGNQQAAAKAGVEVHMVFCQPDADRLHSLAQDVRDGRLKIPIEMRLPLSEIRQAQTEAEKGGRGKIAVLP
jgi:NADPH:quinone reductase-like Zn-dependent oxidoreductase